MSYELRVTRYENAVCRTPLSPQEFKAPPFLHTYSFFRGSLESDSVVGAAFSCTFFNNAPGRRVYNRRQEDAGAIAPWGDIT
jgi:hypothetical protein